MTPESRTSSRRRRSREAGEEAKKNRTDDNWTAYDQNCACDSQGVRIRTVTGLLACHPRDGFKKLASKRPEQGEFPARRLSAASQTSNYNKAIDPRYGGKSMNAKQPGLRSLAVWSVVLAMSLGGFAWTAAAKPHGIAEQDKKEEKGLALKPERKIAFTTDEGTWLSLDVSPDGKTIVFEMLGDIYTLPIEGGQAKLIAGGMSFDSQPKFSPDGQWIAFLSDREGSENIWIMHADGTGVKQVSKDPNSDFISPNWTPDGKYILVSKSAFAIGSMEIWMYHIDGGSGVQITKAKPTPTTRRAERPNAVGVVASPDEKYLYYATKLGSLNYNAQFPMWHIARRDRKTGDEDNIITQIESAFWPVLSPDAKQILYVTRYETETGLRLRNLDTGEDRWVKYPVTRDDQESLFTRDVFPSYAFLPGGKEIVYNKDGKIKRLDLATGTDKVIPFTAQVTQDLGPKLDFPQQVEQGPVKARLIMSPAESPDGKKLAFSAMTHAYTMDIPGGKPQRLTSRNAREFQPAWSPDGKSIAYVTWSSEGGQLWRVAASGGTPVQLSKSLAVYSNPAWSPDGTKIVLLRGNAYDRENSGFDGGQTANADLVWIPADGGDANLILPARGAGGPHFTHEKDRIYVYTALGLVSLRYDGTDRRTHLQVKGQGLYAAEEPVPASDIQPSPDGQWVLAHVMNQLYLIAMPAVGGEAPTVNVMTPVVPARRLTDIGADYFAWADDGKTITWAVGASFFRHPLSAISFEAPKDEKKESEKKDAEARDGEKKEPATQAVEAKKDEKKEEKKEEKKLKGQDKNVEEIAVELEVPRKTPKGTIVLRGATVVTGFIDTHAHWFESRRGSLDTQNWSLLSNLAYGATEGLDVQTSTSDMF